VIIKIYAGRLVFFILLSLLIGCGGSSTNSTSSLGTGGTPQTVTIASSSNTSQSAAGGKPFASPFSVVVTANGILVSGEKVTFTAPSSGASGTFANGTTTDVEVTGSNGTATSSAFTANTTGGSYSVTAGVGGTSATTIFGLTNIPATSYSFYVSGQESATASYYALAGSVVIDSSGNVLSGEQDYNDGGFGYASPEPGGDQITGGSLTFPAGAPPGQGTLTLNTNNLSLGLNSDGVEVFGVQFVNSNHALIIQFDGFDTSSGSMDLQTLPSTLNGGFAFAVSGFDSAETPVDFGGVFSVSGANISNGVLDVNDSDNLGIKIGTSFTGALVTADAYGRGTLSGIRVAGTKVSLVYYIVGPEAIRLVDVDLTDTAVGSAFGQGTSAFSNASLGSSVVALSSTPYSVHFGALAQFSTSDTSSATSNFAGVGDDNEPDNGVISLRSSAISGTYSIAGNGYGNLNIANGGLGDFTTLGVYMTNPALNLNDPNNTTGGGGALAIDLSSDGLLTGGAGVVVPQTDIAVNDFNGNYVAGWQNFNLNCGDCEFDMIAQGSMVPGGLLSLTGLVSDPFYSLGDVDATSSGDTFQGTPVQDTKYPNAGHYIMTGKDAIKSVVDGSRGPRFNMVMFQASSNQLFWLDYDIDLATVSIGPLEQQGSLADIPGIAGSATVKSATSNQHKRK
jgi:hypothetical protein